MKGRVAILVGLVAGVAFVAGWLADLGAQTTMVTALVCGIAAMLGQLSTRDLLSRATALVDRGIDEYFSDGGELMTQARVARDRVERLAITALVAGILAPFFATLRTIYVGPFWAAAAIAVAVASVFLSSLLFAANRELTGLIEQDRLRRTREKNIREANASPKHPQPASQAADPNLMGYKTAGH
jgi:hypothetical protein